MKPGPKEGFVDLPVQTLIPGSLQKAYQREFNDLLAADAVRRLWAKDPSLWPADDSKNEDLNTNLSWLDLPEQIGAQMSHVAALAAAAEAEGFQDVLFVAMGDSNLAAETVLNISVEKRWKRIFLLDSTDPATVRAVDKELDPQRTLFVFASKSGKHIETQALLLYFLQRARAQGISSPGRHFVALTEQGSYLAEISKTYQFRETSFDPPGIRGRYSALIHFGLLLSFLCRLDPAALVSCALAMRDVCRSPAPPEANPALALAAFLAAGAVERNDRFLLFSTKSLAGLPYRVGQLVGVSMNKGGQGLIPIRGDVPGVLGTCRQDCLAGIFSMQGDTDPELEDVKNQLRQSGTPTVLIELNAPQELGAELFKWEVATALACAPLGVNPFSEPDVQEGRQKTAELVEALATKHELPRRTPRIREAGLELFAESATRQQLSTLSLSDALRTFLELKNPHGYLVFLAFLEHSSSVETVLRRLREHLVLKLGIPVLLNFGPRYLHYLGQVYKGGPPKGLFLLLTSEAQQDIEIPGAGYSFGQLQMALALGDFESLESRGKLVVHLHFAEGIERGLAQLEQVILHALRNIRA
jgi:glucose-6-phosphate isomerase